MAGVRKTNWALSFMLLAALVCLSGCATGTSSSTSSGATPTPTPPIHTVAVMWDSSQSSNVQGYKVYRGQVSGGPYTSISGVLAGNTLQFTDSTVALGQTYFYVVTSVDVNGVESAQSTEVSANVPAS